MRDASYPGYGKLAAVKRRGDGQGKVVRTLRELAEEVGVDLRFVISAIALDRENAPVPEFKHKSVAAGKNSYYVRREFHQWWASRKGGDK